jgi:hypothetical protein
VKIEQGDYFPKWNEIEFLKLRKREEDSKENFSPGGWPPIYNVKK